MSSGVDLFRFLEYLFVTSQCLCLDIATCYYLFRSVDDIVEVPAVNPVAVADCDSRQGDVVPVVVFDRCYDVVLHIP